jgi:hypothetical protein
MLIAEPDALPLLVRLLVLLKLEEFTGWIGLAAMALLPAEAVAEAVGALSLLEPQPATRSMSAALAATTGLIGPRTIIELLAASHAPPRPAQPEQHFLPGLYWVRRA